MSRFWTYGRSLLFIALIVLFLLPIYLLVAQSLTAVGTPSPKLEWGEDLHWENYQALFEMLPFWRYIGNSFFVVAVAVPFTWLTSSLAGFAWAQQPERPRRHLLAQSALWLIIPASAVWLFRFQLFDWAGLIDSRLVLIIPAFGGSTPLFVLLFYWTVRAIPANLIDSARLDGATAGQVWWYIINPLVWPTTTAVIILSFALYWGDFMSPVLYIYSPQLYTLPIGVQLVNQLDATQFPLLMAAAVLMMFPVVLLYLWGQKRLLDSIEISS